MVSWKKCLQNLLEKNIGITKIATMVGVPAQVLADLKHDRMEEPPFSMGLRLLDFHLDMCGEENTHKLWEERPLERNARREISALERSGPTTH